MFLISSRLVSALVSSKLHVQDFQIISPQSSEGIYFPHPSYTSKSMSLNANPLT
jgi:hypothetical protein